MNDELYHHGIQGQKWGIRRYQNEDGSLTALGRARLGYENTRASVADARTSYYAKRNKRLQVKIENQNLKNQLKAAKNQNKNKKTEVEKSVTQSLSTKDMQDAVKRYNTEKAYKNMLNEMDAKKKSAAQKFITDSLTTFGNAVVKSGTDMIIDTAKPYVQEKIKNKAEEIFNKKDK